jgi:hypothetical protein
MNDVFIVSAVRTPIGRQMGPFRNYTAPEFLAYALIASEGMDTVIATGCERIFASSSRDLRFILIAEMEVWPSSNCGSIIFRIFFSTKIFTPFVLCSKCYDVINTGKTLSNKGFAIGYSNIFNRKIEVKS